MSSICNLCHISNDIVPLVHISDRGEELEIDHDVSVCRGCQIQYYETNQPCPYCRGRFTRPADPHNCNYVYERISKKRPHLECQNIGIKFHNEKFWCEEHYELGSMEMVVRNTKKEAMRTDKIASRKRKLADEQVNYSVKKAIAMQKDKASDMYLNYMSSITQKAISSLVALPPPPPSTSKSNKPTDSAQLD